MPRISCIGFDYPLPQPGRSLRRGHWSTEGLRALLLPNSGSPSVRVYDPVRDYFTPIASLTHSSNDPTAHGLIQFAAASQSIDVTDNQSTLINPLQTTILLVRQKLDTGLIESIAFGPVAGSASDRCLAHLPYSDGTVYWDFGGTTPGTTELSVAGLTFDLNPEAWAFVAGPHGMAMYQNGVLVGSHSTPAAGPSYTGTFQLNAGLGAGCRHVVSFFAVLDAEWNAQQVQEWSSDQLLMFTRRNIALFGPVATPDTQVKIDGTPRDILQRWQITEQLNERGTMRFGVKSMDASYRPGLRESVDFRAFSRHLFAGHIHHTEEGALARVPYGVVPIETQCGATDFTALLDRRQVEVVFDAGTLKSQVLQAAEHLGVYGVTVDPAQVDGPSMPAMELTRGSIASIFQKLSVISGYALKVTYDKVLSMFAPGTEASPFDIEDNDARVLGDVIVSPTTVDYANRVYVKWTAPAIAAYIFYILDANATDGSTGKVGALTFTFKNTPVDPTDVQIGATTADTISALASVIDGNSDEVDAGVQAADAVRVTAKVAGASGNSIQTETNDPNGRWGVEGFGGISSHLGNGADAALTALADSAMAEDVPAQDGGENLYELVFEEPTITNETAAQALADGYLVRSLVQPREIRYRTRLHGLHPGQQQQIQVTGRNVDGPCLITAVDISPEGSALLTYDVTAVEGLVIVASHQEKWRQMQTRVA